MSFDGLGTPAVTPRMMEIQRVIARHYGITVENIKSACRKRQYSWPRQIAAYLCREMTECSLPEIGRMFGGRDHTTILFSCRKVAFMEASDVKLAETLNAYRAEIRVDAEKRHQAEGLVRIEPPPTKRGYSQIIRKKYQQVPAWLMYAEAMSL